MVHGGPGGQARMPYSPYRQYLVNHGYVVLDVNNRGSSGYGKTFFTADDRVNMDANWVGLRGSEEVLEFSLATWTGRKSASWADRTAATWCRRR